MTFKIEPYKSVGPIKFGMSRPEIRDVLQIEPKPFRKTLSSLIASDAYDDIGVHVHFDESGGCCAVELAAPANPTFRGQSLLGQPLSTLRRQFEEVDDTLEVDETGFTSHKFGIGLFAPFAEDSPEDPVEGVIVFKRGYYREIDLGMRRQ